MQVDASRLSRNARAVLALFDKKPEWTSAEISAKLKRNIETAKKTIKNLVDGGYLVKQGTTKGAWYEKATE
jgi:predicted HTH transcriptional regulator